MNNHVTITKHNTPIGTLTAFWLQDHLIGLTSSAHEENQALYRMLQKYFHVTQWKPVPHAPCDLQNQLNAYFAGTLQSFSIPMQLGGTPFQRQVWEQVSKIPYGQTQSYSDVGLQIGSRAYRAIGSAMKANPLPLLIPCHRVVSAAGIGNYSLCQGKCTKQFLLNLEKQNCRQINPSAD